MRNIKGFYFYIVIKNGTVVGQKYFYPMIRFATDTNPSSPHTSYAMTNQELTNSVVKIDDWTDLVTQSNGVVVFDNLNENYGYKLYFDDNGATGNISVPTWTNINKTAGTTSGIKLTYTVNGTNNVSKFKLRILK